ncbi:MAG: hypothetical protein CBB84_000170 [Phycisphaera sp. TMED24]|nr:MAG: hypothetical protein CBB84_000170 [Phycisphaera sp. TMED24]|tara:strand:+ start:3767 stop:4462 length:696 start_codon:yes stop_codon:yes gene_type:complete
MTSLIHIFYLNDFKKRLRLLNHYCNAYYIKCIEDEVRIIGTNNNCTVELIIRNVKMKPNTKTKMFNIDKTLSLLKSGNRKDSLIIDMTNHNITKLTIYKLNKSTEINYNSGSNDSEEFTLSNDYDTTVILASIKFEKNEAILAFCRNFSKKNMKITVSSNQIILNASCQEYSGSFVQNIDKSELYGYSSQIFTLPADIFMKLSADFQCTNLKFGDNFVIAEGDFGRIIYYI